MPPFDADCWLLADEGWPPWLPDWPCWPVCALWLDDWEPCEPWLDDWLLLELLDELEELDELDDGCGIGTWT